MSDNIKIDEMLGSPRDKSLNSSGSEITISGETITSHDTASEENNVNSDTINLCDENEKNDNVTDSVNINPNENVIIDNGKTSNVTTTEQNFPQGRKL